MAITKAEDAVWDLHFWRASPTAAGFSTRVPHHTTCGDFARAEVLGVRSNLGGRRNNRTHCRLLDGKLKGWQMIVHREYDPAMTKASFYSPTYFKKNTRFAADVW